MTLATCLLLPPCPKVFSSDGPSDVLHMVQADWHQAPARSNQASSTNTNRSRGQHQATPTNTTTRTFTHTATGPPPGGKKNCQLPPHHLTRDKPQHAPQNDGTHRPILPHTPIPNCNPNKQSPPDQAIPPRQADQSQGARPPQILPTTPTTHGTPPRPHTNRKMSLISALMILMKSCRF